MLIRQSAQAILYSKSRVKEVKSTIEKLAENNKSIQVLCDKKLTGFSGVGPVTAAQIVGEVIDIRRFSNNNKLAMYSGFGRAEHETGLKYKGAEKNSRYHPFFNPRLKNAFITMAKNFIRWNPDHRITGMHNHYTINGMKKTEALKRVARALVRVVFKKLIKCKNEELDFAEIKKGTGWQNVENSTTRHQPDKSNTPVPA